MPGTLQYWLTAFTSVLFIVDPPAAVPAFLTLTVAARNKRPALARATALWTGGIMLAFGLAGGAILRLYGITLTAFRVGGGLILVVVALDMLRARRSLHGSAEEVTMAAGGAQAARDATLAPLATPMLAGPGAISTVMVLAGQSRDIAGALPVFLAIVFTTFVTWVVLRSAEPLDRLLGGTGRRALTRLMGLLIAAIGVQFIIDGLLEAGFGIRGPMP